jgi:hypothetical protein
MLAQFKDDHDRLRVMVSDYAALISKGVPPDIIELMKSRTGFTGLFHSHFRAKTGRWRPFVPAIPLARSISCLPSMPRK